MARMLVVDDDPPSRKLLEGYLQAEGYPVVSAADGPSALGLAFDDPPDVVLLDVMMPGMTGHEVCRRLKSDPRTRLCQVMLVTALEGTPDRVAGLDQGADDYATKPVRREELLAKVRALVRARGILRELEQARGDLAQRNAELQLKKALAQSLVHDLKSPLTAILGNLELLAARSGPEARPLVARTQDGARRMLKMILNLLDVERLEEGRLEPALESVDLVELARAAIVESAAPAESRRVTLVLAAETPVWARADAQLMRRVIDNLLSNAIAHTPAGSRVRLRVRQREEGAELVVEDQGPGVPEAWREKIFEKYAQAEPGALADGSNRGLGLTFCRLAVEAHGGTVWVEDAPGGGACFRAVLPRAEAVVAGGPGAAALGA